MNGVLVVAALCAVINAGIAQKVPLKDCGSQLSTIVEVDVLPCPNVPCPFKRGTNVTVTINLTPNTAITDAKTVVHGIIDGQAVEFPIPDSNACNFMNCPLAPGTNVVYSNSIYIQPQFPSLTLVVKWELTSSGGEIVCFTLPVQIV